MPKIFLSHNHNDKPVVEPIAIRLATIFGQENVFYDSWSIQPGDGIVEKMNEGLAAPEFVFFFVSDASLKSGMVKLEWQNALYASTKGKVRIVPIRVDGSSMPAVLLQNVWIDLHGQGIEVALQQMVNVIQGQNTFTPQHLGFSNLTYTVSKIDDENVRLEIAASHLMEPNPLSALISSNSNTEINVLLEDGSPTRGGYTEGGGHLKDGTPANVFAIAPLGGAITPRKPLRIKIARLTAKPILVHGVHHQIGNDEWAMVPMKTAF